MKAIADHRSLIDALGGGAAVASKLNCPAGRVRQWKIENRIPARYWHGVVEIATAADLPDIDFRWLEEKLGQTAASQEAAE